MREELKRLSKNSQGKRGIKILLIQQNQRESMPRPSKLQMTVGEKAAHTRKWRLASQLAHKKAKNAKTFIRHILSQKGYKCVSLDSKKGYEYKGIIDLVAVRRDRKDPDRLNVVLIQVKGGSAKVSRDELKRLRWL